MFAMRVSMNRISSMTMSRALAVAAMGAALAGSAFAARSVEEFKTSAGPLKITIVQHASFMIEAGGQVIDVDPAMGNWDNMPKADLILVTDIHDDHMSPELIGKLKKIGYRNPLTIEREINGEKQTADIRAAKVYLEKLIG